MKKLITISVLLIVLSLTACLNKTASVSDALPINIDDVKEVVTVHVDRMVYNSLNTLLEPTKTIFEGKEYTENFNAELVVIGEFVGEAESKLDYMYNDHFKKEVVNDANAYNQFRVTEVLKGDVKVGETITIVQRYAFEEERGALISFSELTPMHKGDRWIYFLKRSEYADREAYYSAGDSDGRYPIPTQALKQTAQEVSAKTAKLHSKSDGCGDECVAVREKAVSRVGASTLGVLDLNDFKFELYLEILDYFNIETQDWANPGQSFDVKLIGLANQNN